ncbi:hypothetical protein CH75_19865 [Dyella jiangningensis]|nr:hypothetical protein CH75_19865 [Dyella jiangningensis]
MNYGAFRHPSAWLPMAMSLAALCIVAGHLIFVGTAREADEGAAAHLFQLLMAGQVPIILFFAVKWFKRATATALSVILVQVMAGAIACASVWYFGL